MRTASMLLTLAVLLGACATGHQHTMLTAWEGTSLKGLEETDGDWFVVGSHVIRQVDPFSTGDDKGVTAHLDAIETILKRHGMFEGGAEPTAGLRAAAARKEGTDIITAMTGFNDLMAKDIPTERGTAFYVLGIAAGGLDVHARKQSREGLESLLGSLDQAIDVIGPQVADLPEAYYGLGGALKDLITRKAPFDEINETLAALFAGMPTSVGTR
jgi:hypothetical protein